eukprot:364909-Chlamydomonas_euryale.AAC.3
MRACTGRALCEWAALKSVKEHYASACVDQRFESRVREPAGALPSTHTVHSACTHACTRAHACLGACRRPAVHTHSAKRMHTCMHVGSLSSTCTVHSACTHACPRAHACLGAYAHMHACRLPVVHTHSA